MVTPELDSKETKLCRNSRGVHSLGLSPAALATRRNERWTLLVQFALIRGRSTRHQRLSAGLGPIRLYQRVQQRLASFLTSTGSGALMWLVLEVPGRRTGVIRRTRLEG